MSDHVPAIDDQLIDAWLAGELSDEQAALVEQSIGTPADPASPEPEERELLREIAQTDKQPEVEQLIDAVKTQHAPDLPAPSEDAWREILTPADDPEILGTLGDYEVVCWVDAEGEELTAAFAALAHRPLHLAVDEKSTPRARARRRNIGSSKYRPIRSSRTIATIAHPTWTAALASVISPPPVGASKAATSSMGTMARS